MPRHCRLRCRVLILVVSSLCLSNLARGQEVANTKIWGDMLLYLRSGGKLRDKETRILRHQIDDWSHDLPRQQKLISALGVPLNPDGLNRKIPPARDASIEYRELSDELTRHPLTPNDETLIAMKLSTASIEQIVNVRKLLGGRQTVFEIINRATLKPDCAFVRNWSLGMQLTFPEYAKMRACARLLKSQAVSLALDRKFSAAVDCSPRA
jgi:hypothetical protein